MRANCPYRQLEATIQAKWTTQRELTKLRALIVNAKKQGDLRTWRCGKAVRDHVNGKTVLAIVAELEVARASVNQWLRWYDTAGTEALQPRKAPGPAPRLDVAQREALTRLIEEGPQAAGYTGGIWTGPRIGDLIRRMSPPASKGTISTGIIGTQGTNYKDTARMFCWRSPLAVRWSFVQWIQREPSQPRFEHRTSRSASAEMPRWLM